MAENREHPRATIELRVDYRKLNSFFADYTKNISKGGTFIRTRKALPIGTRFLFRLAVPGREAPIDLSGEVVHAEPQGEHAGMGIRFVWADEGEKEHFGAVVEQLMVDSLGPAVTQALLKEARKGS